MNPYYFFGILYMLIVEKRVTRKEIATRFEISTRTVSRYIDYLILCGIPIYSETGVGGGYGLPDDYKLESTFLSDDERARLINCLKAAAGNFSDDMNAHLVDKLSALGSSGEEKYLLRTDTLIIDAGSWSNPQVYRNKINVLSKAIEQHHSIRMRYIDRYEYATERTFDPYCLVLKEGVWYVYGFCHIRDDFRLFKLSRTRDLIATEERFERRESDVYAKLHGGFDDSELVDFTIEFSNMVLSDVEEWLGLDAISERGTQYVARARMYGGNVLTAKLLSFGSSVKVLSPPALREEILVECKRILANAKK